MIALLTVSALGLVINSIILLAMLRDQKLRRCPLNLLLIIVQLSDLLIQLGVFVNVSRSVNLDVSPGYLPHCRMFAVALKYFSAVSIYCLTAVAISRYYLIVRQRKWGFTHYSAMVAVSCILAFVDVVTITASASTSDSGAGRLLCAPVSNNPLPFQRTSATTRNLLTMFCCLDVSQSWNKHGLQLVVTIPVLVGGSLSAAASSFCYNRIFNHIKEVKLAVRATLSSTQASKQIDIEDHLDVVAVRRLFRVNLLFFLGWVMYLAEIVYEVATKSRVPALYDQLAILSICLTLAAAPLMWTWGNRQLTEAVKQLFGVATANMQQQSELRTRRSSLTHVAVDSQRMLNVHVSHSQAASPQQKRSKRLSRSASIVYPSHRPSFSVMDQHMRSARLRSHQSADEIHSLPIVIDDGLLSLGGRRATDTTLSSYRPLVPTGNQVGRSPGTTSRSYTLQLQPQERLLQVPSPRVSRPSVDSGSPSATISLAAPPVPRIILVRQASSVLGKGTYINPPTQTPSMSTTPDPSYRSLPLSSTTWSSPMISSDGLTAVGTASMASINASLLSSGVGSNTAYQLSTVYSDSSPISQPRKMVPIIVSPTKAAANKGKKVLPEPPTSIHRRCTSTASMPELISYDTPVDVSSEVLSNLESMHTFYRQESDVSERGSS